MEMKEIKVKRRMEGKMYDYDDTVDIPDGDERDERDEGEEENGGEEVL